MESFLKNNKLIPPYALKNEDLNFVEKGWREAADFTKYMVQKGKYKKIFKKVILFYLIATFLLKRYKFESSIKNQNK